MKITEKNFRNFEAWALVTGAASGMGRLYSKQLALKGYNIIAVDINAAGLEAVSAEISAEIAGLSDWRSGSKEAFRILPVVQDLSKMEAAAELHSKTTAAGVEEVEVLINNAGLLIYGYLLKEDPVKLSRIMMVHSFTPLLICREYMPAMVRKGNGYVLNISSLAAVMPWPVIGMYGNTKRFTKGYSRQLRVECRGTGVSVTNAYFGAVDTPLIGLKPNLRKLAHNLGVMIYPEKAIDSALCATFARRKGAMPGFMNWIFYPICAILPDCILSLMVRLIGGVLGVPPRLVIED